MTSFYIKTDLDVAGPFTGIEIREASLAGILKFNTFLAGSPGGPWIAAVDAGLFSETGVALPHPAGTEVPVFQTRGMPGAFMGPFKLRELIGFACQGMLPPGTELQSDPSRPWIPITGTGILPSCLRGELVRIEENGRLCLRTVIPKDLERRKHQLETLQSPIQRAQQLNAKGATAKPLADRVEMKTGGTDELHAETDQGEQPIAPPRVNPRSASGAPTYDENVQASSPRKPHGAALPVRMVSSVGRSVRGLFSNPKIAVAALVMVVCTIGLPVAYSSWIRTPLPRLNVLGRWVSLTDQSSETATPELGVALLENGTCVLIDAKGKSWTGDFKWINRHDEESGFRPSDEIAITYDTAEPDHQEALVVASDGYLRLTGFVKEPPLLDGHPVRELFVRRVGDQLWLGYPVSAQWIEGQRQLTAAWLVFDKAVQPAQSISGLLRDFPDDSGATSADTNQTQSLSNAFDAATKGREFEYKGHKRFRNGCFVDSRIVDAAYLLKYAGIPDEARPLHEFEKQPSYNGPSMDDVQLLRYDNVRIFISLEGKILFLELADGPDRASS